jgi:hypothetical protein
VPEGLDPRRALLLGTHPPPCRGGAPASGKAARARVSRRGGKEDGGLFLIASRF